MIPSEDANCGNCQNQRKCENNPNYTEYARGLIRAGNAICSNWKEAEEVQMTMPIKEMVG